MIITFSLQSLLNGYKWLEIIQEQQNVMKRFSI